MLICTKRWKEPNDEKFQYKILDTDDGVSEVARIGTIKNVLSQGIAIYGLILESNGSVTVDTGKMLSTSEYRYIDGRDSYIQCYELEVEFWDRENNLYSIKGVDMILTHCVKLSVFYKDTFIGAFSYQEKLRRYFYVEVNTVELYSYKGKYLADVHTSYYDKHYYREDEGKSFYARHLLYNEQELARTDFDTPEEQYSDCSIHHSFGSVISELTEGSFRWCGYNISL